LSAILIEMSRESLYLLFKESSARKLDDKVIFMEQKLQDLMNCPQNEFQTLHHDLKNFKYDLKEKWRSAQYNEERFFQKNREWLNSSIHIHKWISIIKPGRPSKEFQDLSDRSKRRKTKEIREQVPVEELTFAASVSQRMSGNVSASKLIKESTVTPSRATKYRKLIDAAQKPRIKKNTPEESLNLFVAGDFSRRQWDLLHESNRSVFPCYTLIIEAKKLCYPKPESVRVTETCAEVVLQDLLDHTVSRLCLFLEDVLQNCTEEELKNLELISKWGCDGSHQSAYQQKFQDSTQDDSNIFQSSLVPLRLQSHIFARKFSRTQCNQDVLNRLLLTSDPLLSSNHQRKRSKSQPFLTETIELFEPKEPDHEEIEETIRLDHSDESD
ncbi:uncharacterized protein LOC129909398, partial [Episyrphus balteatus]|uniref:uncharacterized protein LOC129909398 n=1 Tax=Episyrphus balteatus TaxID=286459 RepID=UPI0024858353